MSTIAPMPNYPPISQDELISILTADKEDARPTTYRLSGEARRIISAEAERYGVDMTKALELLLREIRELRKEAAKKKR